MQFENTASDGVDGPRDGIAMRQVGSVVNAKRGKGRPLHRLRDIRVLSVLNPLVFSDGREAGFLARHAEEHRIPVSILPTADLVRTARQSIDRDQEARETQDRTIRKGPSIGF